MIRIARRFTSSLHLVFNSLQIAIWIAKPLFYYKSKLMHRDLYRVYSLLVFIFTPWLTSTIAAAPFPPSPSPSEEITQLKQRLETIEKSLGNLASISIRGGFGPIGIASNQYKDAKRSTWLEIQLEKLTPIDQIILVPAISQNSLGKIQSDGFPVEFAIIAGSGDDQKGIEVARYDKSDGLLPRRAPLVVNCSLEASWVRIEISELSRHAINDRYILKLAEVLIFSGSENIALRRKVKIPKGFINSQYAQHPQFLTDGFTPYIMNAAKGKQGYSVISKGGTNELYALTIDLGEPYSLSHINLHATYTNYSVPLYTASDSGIPHHWVLEGSLTADFAKTKILANVQYNSLLEVGPILQHRVTSTPSRYLRLREAMSSYEKRGPSSQSQRRAIGFSEIELIADGMNVAKGKLFTANFQTIKKQNIERLTDGLNFYGHIIPIRQWMNQLAERHDLEMEQQEIHTKLEALYTQQESRLRWMRRAGIGLAIGIFVVILLGRMMSLRKIIQMRERMAANLHDELSADLHAVALLGDLAYKNIDRKPKLTDTLTKLKEISNHSRHSVRHCMNMLQAETACDDLVAEMKRINQRLLGEIDHQLDIEGLEWIEQLPARKRLDISLYYKEAIINILRHSNTSACHTELSGSSDCIRLELCDNGALLNQAPSSLQRRAALLRAKLDYEVTPSGENSLILTLNTQSLLARLLTRRNNPPSDQG